MRRKSSDLTDLNDRVEAIERFLWGDDIDDGGFAAPPPPGPGGLMRRIAEIEDLDGQADPGLTRLKIRINRLARRAEVEEPA